MSSTSDQRVPVAVWRAQALAILSGWGMSDDHARVVCDVLVAADVMGIDSHGLTLCALYEQQLLNGGATARPDITVVQDRAAVALIDAGAGFGQVPSMMAVDMAAERAERFGISAIAIRNSNHYGAAGVYVRKLAEAGFVGVSTTSVWRAGVVPTGGLEAKLGTNPIAFAAPSASGRPFLLDMATSTAAIGKLKLADRAGKPLPDGWSQTREGAPQHDAALALLDPLLLPLGGHKGYGLATMVEVLSSVLSGAALTPARGAPGKHHDVGHFVMAIDPALVRGSRAEFETDLDRMVDSLRATAPIDAARPVMTAGDPEYKCETERLANGIPLSDKLAAQLREIAERAGADFLLGTEPLSA